MKKAEQSDKPTSNIPEFSVGDLAQSLKRTLEETYGHVRVRGELSRVTIHSSGHMYSTLKDDKANIDAVCWRGTLSKITVKPEEGLEVICTGRISTYPARSNYQLIIESMELAGEGALLKMLKQRKRALQAEGLFDEGRKRALPFLPRHIGVVTSPTGAVFRDILHRVRDRFPMPVTLWPVLVQGDGAAEQIVKAIDGFQRLEDGKRPDVLIVGRGGGSLEDLMPFNEEIVVRAIAACKIPVISAVGHETDTTLADFAADKRAPTPTGAAEMAVPERLALLSYVQELSGRQTQSIRKLGEEKAFRLESLSARLGDPVRILEPHLQKLDFLSDRLTRGFERFVTLKQSVLTALVGRLRTPQDRLSEAQRTLALRADQLDRIGSRLCDPWRERLSTNVRMLETLSFKNVLKRGFVVVRDKDNNPVTHGKNLKDGDAVAIQFQDIEGVTARIGAGSTKDQPVKKTKPAPATQESLF